MQVKSLCFYLHNNSFFLFIIALRAWNVQHAAPQLFDLTTNEFPFRSTTSFILRGHLAATCNYFIFSQN